MVELQDKPHLLFVCGISSHSEWSVGGRERGKMLECGYINIFPDVRRVRFSLLREVFLSSALQLSCGSSYCEEKADTV